MMNHGNIVLCWAVLFAPGIVALAFSGTGNGRQAEPDAALMKTLPEIPFDKRFDAYLHKETGRMSNAVVERKVLVDTFVNQQVVFFAGGEQTAPTLELARPDGKRLDLSDTNRVAHYAFGRLNAYRIRSPEVGEWTATLRAPAGMKAQRYVFAVTGQGDQNLFFHAGAKFETKPERRLLVTGSVQGFVGVKGIRISGRLFHPDGKTQSFDLHDDGNPKHGDEYDNDGRYANRVSGLMLPGAYHVQLLAIGKSGMTVVPGDAPDLAVAKGSRPIQSTPVPTFRRFFEKNVLIQ